MRINGFALRYGSLLKNMLHGQATSKYSRSHPPQTDGDGTHFKCTTVFIVSWTLVVWSSPDLAGNINIDVG